MSTHTLLRTKNSEGADTNVGTLDYPIASTKCLYATWQNA